MSQITPTVVKCIIFYVVAGLTPSVSLIWPWGNIGTMPLGIGAWALIALIALVPIASGILHYLDVTKGDGHITVGGRA